MVKPKDILATTASTLEGRKILNHLGPISSHVVAGTNLFSDFFASFSDVFGGRSTTYQKQLSSIYNEAIDKLKFSAYEIGANCIIGLKVDLDEISGKGKSMFMVTAIGTAVIIEMNERIDSVEDSKKKYENVSLENIRTLSRTKEIINQANEGSLALTDEIWEFITVNKVPELFPHIVGLLKMYMEREQYPQFYDNIVNYIDIFPDEKKSELLYNSILNVENEEVVNQLCTIIEKLRLLDFKFIDEIIALEENKKRKLALRLLTYDKPYYNQVDVEKLKSYLELIKEKFPEKGVHSSKKGFLSSKDKEVWICECKTTNDFGTYCKNCFKDIYGFTSREISPPASIAILEEKINLISEFLE